MAEVPAPSVSIIIPCYNEEANLGTGCLARVVSYAEGSSGVREVIVVDDGSTDDSRALVSSLAQRSPKLQLLPEPHRGKAGAVIAGIMAARGSHVLFTDMDQATPIEEFTKLQRFLEQGYDVVVGSRLHRREGAPLVRRLMATGFMLVRRLILDLGGIADTQCGFKSFRTDLARAACERLRIFRPGVAQARGAAVTAAFDAELLFVARGLGARVVEVPVTWHYVGTRRVHPILESWRGLKGLLLIRMRAHRGEYDFSAASSCGSEATLDSRGGDAAPPTQNERGATTP